MSETIKLTQYSSSSGCGCKIHPAELEEIIQDIKTGQDFPNLLVGNDRSDDASVMRLNDGELLIQTSDFFTPIVDDAYLFGKIAAANALSDVYAMGGKPLMANALLGWPTDKLSTTLANTVIKGAIEICEQAGIPLAGGHSIKIQEPLFGLSVTGTCNESDLKTNSGAQNGDLLFITKPLGIGILATAHKRGILKTEGFHKFVKYASHLNIEGALFGKLTYVNAMTDVTGFGFFGHLLEMTKQSNLGVLLNGAQIPLISEAIELAAQFIMPDNTYRNWNAYEKQVENCPADLFALLNDPQTNGGLMLAIDKNHLEEFELFCASNEIKAFNIGVFDTYTKIHFS